MPGVNYVIYGCSSWRTTPGAQTWGETIFAVITQDRVIDDNLKKKINNWTLHTCRLFLLTWIFQ